MSFLVLALVPCGVFALQAQSGPPPIDLSRPGAFDELYRQGYRTAAAVTTLTARVTETTTSALLTRPIVARGTIAVQRPSRVVLRFTDPDERTILIDGDRMTTVWPSRQLRDVANVASAQKRIQRYLEQDTPDELRRQFTIEPQAGGGRSGGYAVALLPKRKQVRETVTRLDLWIGHPSLLLDALELTFGNGDTKRLEFHDVAINPVLDPDTFVIHP